MAKDDCRIDEGVLSVHAGRAHTGIDSLPLHDPLPIYPPRAGQIGSAVCVRPGPPSWPVDRKSTRLNSSHGSSSYAVFCLKKRAVEVMNAADRWGAELSAVAALRGFKPLAESKHDHGAE